VPLTNYSLTHSLTVKESVIKDNLWYVTYKLFNLAVKQTVPLI